MYSNPKQWAEIRKRVLVKGESIGSVSRSERMSPNTVKKILKLEAPPGDAASWHMSKALVTFIDEHNEVAVDNRRPLVELVPLPASAQFLNVIESVFSGMARSIIHGSNYESKDAAIQAINMYFQERNENFRANPRRVGNKIWGKERSSSEFSSSHNCKDPAYR